MPHQVVEDAGVSFLENSVEGIVKFKLKLEQMEDSLQKKRVFLIMLLFEQWFDSVDQLVCISHVAGYMPQHLDEGGKLPPSDQVEEHL